MLLRALTIIAVVVGLVFVAWSLLVMTGGRDWIVATMTTEEEAPKKVATKQEELKDEAKPADQSAEAKQAEAPATDKAAAAEDGPAPDETAKGEGESADTAEGETAPADAAAKGEGVAESADAGASEGSGGDIDPAGNPAETAKSAEKGSLTNPYRDNYEEVAEEGHKKYMAAGCNGCHGGTGGGGMGPPLSNPVWVYGNDGDTLFRLIALGSDGLHEQGYVRKGSENVVGPMPPHGSIVKSNDDMWKIIGWIWSINPPDKAASAQ
ncbi:MAG TPA: c-type cytochrome [Methyloceanibacter sp.]|nr:c-type cytochrome [Methyloceanibacter sp.]